MIGYLLPTGDGRRVLWFPAPRIVWGELTGLGDEVQLLSPSTDVEVKDIPLLLHDNIFRPSLINYIPRFKHNWVSRLMLWGLIWLVGMNNPLEDMVGGLYLLIGLPLFIRLATAAMRKHVDNVVANFDSLFYSPTVKIVYSERLLKLELLIDQKGKAFALHKLDELGLGHLREFYRRTKWQGRWQVPPPMGAGVIS